MCIFLLGIVKFARNLYKVFRTNCDEINTQNLMQSFWWYILFLYILYCFFPPISLDFLCFFFYFKRTKFHLSFLSNFSKYNRLY